jgi:acetyl-CoA carboxylase biotin carboxyl carrier protein
MAKKAKLDADQDADPNAIVEMARGLAEIVTEHHLTELVIENNGTTITLRRDLAPMAAPMQVPMPHMHAPPPAHAFAAQGSGPTPMVPVLVDDKSHVVTSPFVGTFYRKPNPDSANYVSLNDRVEKGSVLCIVEAMKLMNEIEADVAGTVVGILVEDGAPVEYGQALFKIAP